jgi:N-acetylneuraminic acid mutarotase
VYGGHKGRPHHYYKSGQVNELWKLDLDSPEKWEVVTKGPHLQGLAMVAYGGKLYRVGGFAAHNEEDEEHDLRSVADVVRFDPQTSQWESLAPLPESRSSHDAVLIGDKLYVVGGWQLSGEEENWHTTAWVADLSEEGITWKQLPTPPFQRRALSLGHLQGKLYVIGGMQQERGPTTRVDVFDPNSGQWSRGPSLLDPKPDTESGEGDEGMEGFGSSAYTVEDQLFVSAYSGNLQCLESNTNEWRVVQQLKEDRFFHRMLPFRQRLLLVGGASMRSGKRLYLEAVELSSLK